MRKSCFRAYSRMARRWLRTSCCAVETRADGSAGDFGLVVLGEDGVEPSAGCAAPRSPPWSGATSRRHRAPGGSACGASKTNTDGRREDLRLLAGPFARAVDRLRTAEEPDPDGRIRGE